MSGDLPVVTVLTATRNGAAFLPETLASVGRQTFPRFEYLIVDDASEDSTPHILAAYAAGDSRVRLLRNERPLGPGGALNRGLSTARAPYIAILDHDDLAAPRRLERQVQFMERHPAVGVLGTAFDWFDSQGRLYHQRNPTHPELLRWMLLFSNPVCHSSAMMRRELLLVVGGYSSRQRYTVDYELFVRLAGQTILTNLSETLAAYRVSPGQTSRRHADAQRAEATLLAYAQLRRLLGGNLTLELARAICAARAGAPLRDADIVGQVAVLLRHVYDAYVATTPLSEVGAAQIRARLALQLLSLATANAGHAPGPALILTRRALELDRWALLRPTNWQILRLHQRRRRGAGPELPRDTAEPAPTAIGP